MRAFIERVEGGRVEKQQAILRAKERRIETARESVPEDAFDLPLITLGFSDHLISLLEDSEIDSVGELMFQMNLDRSVIEDIKGIGPKTMQEIEEAIELMTLSMPSSTPSESEGEEETEAAEERQQEEPTETTQEEEPEPEEEAAADEDEQPEEVEPPMVEQPQAEEEVLTEEAPVEEEQAAQTMAESTPDDLEKLDETAEKDERELEEQDAEKDQKRKKYVEVEYDPERDVTIYRKKHKRSAKDWEEWEGELDDDLLEDYEQ